MANLDLNSTQTTSLSSQVESYTVSSITLDVAGVPETRYNSPQWTRNISYYKSVPEFKETTRALSRWSFGRGWVAKDKQVGARLRRFTGMGEDCFQSIIQNLMNTKKINGDAYAEIIRNDKGIIVDLKPMNPSTTVTVVNEKGIIIRYEELNIKTNAKVNEFKPHEIFHIMQDRIANEIHGTSSLEAVKWAIDARNEAMADKRRVHHNSTIRIIEVDVDDTDMMAHLSTQYGKAIANGDVLLVPFDNVRFPDAPINYIDTQQWIQYLEGFIYQALGVPKAIANTSDFTEAGSKTGYLTFEPVYVEEQTLMEADLWSQLAIDVKFQRPPSIAPQAQEEEEKSPLGFQPSDAQVSQAPVTPQQSPAVGAIPQ